MATAAQAKSFIALIAPLVQKYAKANGYHVASPIIAQACCESAFGTSSLWSKYFNGFGMKCGSSWKGKSVNMTTKEEYTPGQLTTIKDNFRVYDSPEEGVKGYFDFIKAVRYSNLKTAKTPEEYLERIKKDGYATSSTYVKTNMNIVNKYNLTVYDDFSGASTVETPVSKPENATQSTSQPVSQPSSNERKATQAAQKMDKSLAGVYRCMANLNVRNGSGVENASMVVLPKGHLVHNYGYYSVAKNGKSWLYIKTEYRGVTYIGFCSAEWLKKG